MTKLDITKSSNEDIDNLYNSVVDLEVKKIINQDGFPTKENIIDYNQTKLTDIYIDIDELLLPVKALDWEDLPEDITIGEGNHILDKNYRDKQRYEEFHNRLLSVPDDVLSRIEEMWASKEVTMLSDEKIRYIVYQAGMGPINLVATVDLLKHVLK